VKIRHEGISASNPISFIDTICHHDKDHHKLSHQQISILEEKALNSEGFYDHVYNSHVTKFYETIITVNNEVHQCSLLWGITTTTISQNFTIKIGSERV